MVDGPRADRILNNSRHSVGVNKDNFAMRKMDVNRDGYIDFMEYFESNKPKEELSDEDMYNYMKDLNVEFSKKSGGKDKIDLKLQTSNSNNKVPSSVKSSMEVFLDKIDSMMKFPAYVAENGALKLDENGKPVPARDQSGNLKYVQVDVLSAEEKEILEKIKSFDYSDNYEMYKDMVRISEKVVKESKVIQENNLFTYDIKTDTQGTCAPLQDN